MNMLRPLNKIMTVFGYVFCLFLLARAVFSFLVCNTSQEEIIVTHERLGQSKHVYPMEVFKERSIPTWRPGSPLPIDANQAMNIVENWISKNRPELASFPSYAEELALKHLSDDNWYYQYDAWIMLKGHTPSDSITISILMDGSIWEPIVSHR